jgi:hypothetical protein
MSRDIGNDPDLHQGPDRLIFRGPVGPPVGLPVPWYLRSGLMVRVRRISPVTVKTNAFRLLLNASVTRRQLLG